MIRKNYLTRRLGGALAGLGLLLSGYNADAKLDPTKAVQTDIQAAAFITHPAQRDKKKPARRSTNSNGLNTHTSLVDYLRSKGESTSYRYRKKECEKLGVKNYTGTSDQNTACLAALWKGTRPAVETKEEPSLRSLLGDLRLTDADGNDYTVKTGEFVPPGTYTLRSTQDDDRLLVLDKSAADRLMKDYNVRHTGDLGHAIAKHWEEFKERFGDTFDYLSGLELNPEENYFVVTRDDTHKATGVQFLGVAPGKKEAPASQPAAEASAETPAEAGSSEAGKWSLYAAPRVWAHQKAQLSYALEAGAERKLPEISDKLSLRLGLMGIYQAGNNDTHKSSRVTDEYVEADGRTLRRETMHTKMDSERRELFGGRVDALYSLLDSGSVKIGVYAGMDLLLEKWSRNRTDSFDLDIVRNDIVRNGQVIGAYGARDTIVSKNNKYQGKLVPHLGVEGRVPLGDKGELLLDVEGRYDGRHKTPGVGGAVGFKYDF